MEKTLKLIVTTGRPATGLGGVIEIKPEELKEFAINTNYGGFCYIHGPTILLSNYGYWRESINREPSRTV